MDSKFANFFEQIDRFIKAGDTIAAKQLLLSENIVRLPRDQRLAFAIQCRRLHLHTLSLRVLNPIVRPSARKTNTATEREQAEYAVALSNIGATTEALSLLSSLDAKQNPEIYLLTAFTLFSRWNYRDAVSRLELYVEHPSLTPYARLIGKINLAAALVFERDRRAEQLLNDVISECKTTNSIPALAYSERLLAEHHFYHGNITRARSLLGSAWQALQNSDSLEALFVRKWLATLALYQNGPQSIRSEWEIVKAWALKRKHWESLRNCDYHFAVATKDHDLLNRVLAGSPYPSHNQKLLLDFQAATTLTTFFNWKIGKGNGPIVDLNELPTSLTKQAVRPGRKLYLLLTALSSDFYRPIRIAEIHSSLFPNEYFNPRSSPHRVAQLIMRLRAALKRSKLPLEIIEADGSYFLESSGVTLRLPLQRTYSASSDHRLGELRQIKKTRFSIHDAAKHLNIEVWTAKRLLREAVNLGEVEKMGSGNQVRYCFPDKLADHRKAG